MLLPHGATVLSVDGGRMRLYRNRGQTVEIKLESLHSADLDNPRTHVLDAHPPGRSFESGSPSRSAHETTDRHQQREDRFCRDALDKALAAVGDGGELVLVAPPRVLGDLREPKNYALGLRVHSRTLRPVMRLRSLINALADRTCAARALMALANLACWYRTLAAPY